MKTLIFAIIIFFGCGLSNQYADTNKDVEIDPCELDIRHLDVLQCVKDKSATLDNFETVLCECKKEFMKKYFHEDGQK